MAAIYRTIICRSYLYLSDPVGVQEMLTFFQKPCIDLNKATLEVFNLRVGGQVEVMSGQQTIIFRLERDANLNR